MSGYSLEPTGVTPTPPAPRHRLWKVTTAVLAVVVAVLTALLLRAHGVIGSEQDQSAAKMGWEACQLVQHLERDFEDDFQLSVDRLRAARTLASLATDRDSTYAELDAALSPRPESGDEEPVVRTDEIRAACADLAEVWEW